MRILAGCLVAAAISLSSLNAAAKPITDHSGISIRDQSKSGAPARPDNSESRNKGRSASPKEQKNPSDAYAETMVRFKRAQKAYAEAMRSRATCLVASAAERCSSPPAMPTIPGPPPPTQRTIGAGPTISGEDAAYIAFARLRLVPPSPVIGPSPERNPWKLAAVGYPLWLSVSGDTSPSRVSDAVANVSVSLEARVSQVAFSMGDGRSVTCRDVTTPWTTRVEPGAPSPACGYAYEKPSLPKGSYTVTATIYWSVAWSTSTESGVIDFIQESNTQLPVGELQVLVR